MAEHLPLLTEPAGPTTPEALIADRQHFWTGFTRFIVGGVIVVIAILLFLGWITIW